MNFNWNTNARPNFLPSTMSLLLYSTVTFQEDVAEVLPILLVSLFVPSVLLCVICGKETVAS